LIKGFAPTANKFVKFGIFAVLGQKFLYMDRSTWNNLARHRGFSVYSDVPDLAIISGTCRPCGAKNRKIAPWVILITQSQQKDTTSGI